MAEISLSRGYRAVIDDIDLPIISGRPWYVLEPKDRPGLRYAISRCTRDGKTTPPLYMHRLILGARPGEKVDHADGDGLNNRRENLRCATTSQNMMNSRKARGATSRFKGVSWDKRRGTWVAYIKADRLIHLGSFDDEEAASRAYNGAASRIFGEFARPNLL